MELTPTMGLFSCVSPAPPIEVLDMSRMYQEDENPNKINLTVGGYKDENGRPWVLPVVRETERELSEDPGTTHEYLPALGSPDANKAAIQLLLGDQHPAIRTGRAFSIQSIGGTGPLRVGAEFLQQQIGCRTVRYSQPTWINHRDIFIKSGFTDVAPYPYWDPKTQAPCIEELMKMMTSSPPNTVFILHAVAHNPTGLDPTREQWQVICSIMKERKLIPFFDCAYQGFGSGDLDKDAWAVRYFADQGMEMFISQSFGKNLGLYGDRIGFLSIVVGDADQVESVRSQLTLILRPMYGNPCRPAARLVEKILLNPHKKAAWCSQLSSMVDRVNRVRKDLRAKLELLAPQKDWTSITQQVGMFWYSGLTPAQGWDLAKNHIYMMPSNGRICLCGLNTTNLDYFAKIVALITT